MKYLWLKCKGWELIQVHEVEYIPKVLVLCKYFITLNNCISIHIWSLQHLYGTFTNSDLSTPWRECRSLHLRCGQTPGALSMSLSLSHATCPPLPAEDTTWNCAYSIKLSMDIWIFLLHAMYHETCPKLSETPVHLERPCSNMHESNAHWSSIYNHLMEQLTSICMKLPVLAFF